MTAAPSPVLPTSLRTVPLPRLLLAWFFLVAGLAVGFSLLRSPLTGKPLIYLLSATWMVMATGTL